MATVNYAASHAQAAVAADPRVARYPSIGSARMLASAERMCRASGLDLDIVAGESQVERVLELTGVPTLFRYRSTLRAALHS